MQIPSFLDRNDPLSDSEQKKFIQPAPLQYGTNHEVMLSTGCFGEDISMIRASQPQAIFDQVDQNAIKNELKTLSPQCKKEGDPVMNYDNSNPIAMGGKKHNLQVLGSK